MSVRPCRAPSFGLKHIMPSPSEHGLTLVHFSPQPEPFLTQNKPPNAPKYPRKHPLNTLWRTPQRTLYPMESAYVELYSGRV